MIENANFLVEALEEAGMQVRVDLCFVVAVGKMCHLEDTFDKVADGICGYCCDSNYVTGGNLLDCSIDIVVDFQFFDSLVVDLLLMFLCNYGYNHPISDYVHECDMVHLGCLLKCCYCTSCLIDNFLDCHNCLDYSCKWCHCHLCCHHFPCWYCPCCRFYSCYFHFCFRFDCLCIIRHCCCLVFKLNGHCFCCHSFFSFSSLCPLFTSSSPCIHKFLPTILQCDQFAGLCETGPANAA